MTRSQFTALATLLVGSVAATAAAPTPNPLLPLTQRDKDKVDAVGCIVQFDVGRRTLVYALDTTLTVRTKAGASLCKAPERAFEAFREGKGALTCGGQRLRFSYPGKIDDSGEGDGSTTPMTLTVGTGPTAATVRGAVSVGC